MTSLRRRLPLLILALLLCSGLAFAWTAYREMERALRAQGEQRLAGASAQVADLLGQSAAARLAECRKLASDPAIRHYATTGEGREAAMVPLDAAFKRNAQATISFYAADGSRLIQLGPARVTTNETERALADGVSALRADEGRVSYRTTAMVTPESGTTAAASGWISIERTLGAAAAADLIARLIGTGATLKVGNDSGTVWTNLAKPVDAPPTPSTGPSAVRFANAAGVKHLGLAAPVAGAPWRVWVEFPEASLLEPARALLRELLPATLFLIGAGVFAVYAVSGRITKPLEEVADAADAIAAGHYSRRVDIRRRDEIGRLAAAFNTMAARVAESHEALEARVAARTKDVEDAREELDQFFSQSLDMLCIAGTDGYFKRLNPAWSETLGWSVTDLCRKPYLDFIHPEDVESTVREAAKLSTGIHTISFENRYRCRDGSYRWLQWKAFPSPARELVYASARDVTDRKAAEHDIRALNAQLEQRVSELNALTKELEAFSYSVSHDLRAPLRHITGFATLLEKSASASLSESDLRYVRTISEAATRMGRLIDDLLVFSRMGRAEMMHSAVNLASLVRDVQREISLDLKGRSITWKIHTLPVVQADPSMLRLVLTNLMSNAVKYTSTRADAQIEIGSRIAGGETVIYVRDNGVGFDMAYAGKLFGVFQRLHRAEEFEGTGIGLANVRRIIHRHGGRTWAEAKEGHGATFYVTLPNRIVHQLVEAQPA